MVFGSRRKVMFSLYYYGVDDAFLFLFIPIYSITRSIEIHKPKD